MEPPPGRRTRLPELVVGVALMVGFALAAVLWHMSATDKQPALALARSISRGHAIEAADLRVVYLSSDDPIARLGRGESSAVVVRIALSDLPAGTLLTRGSVAPRVAIGPNEGVVGLALEPGQVPATELLPGDLVNVIGGPAEGAGAGAVQPAGSQTAVLASRASVYAVGDLGTQGRRFVSVKLPEADANRVAAAAERGPVRLVLVAR
ncbi:MAG: hypothetical protein ACRD1K_21340 [Acidimicrobiales bacterium]